MQAPHRSFAGQQRVELSNPEEVFPAAAVYPLLGVDPDPVPR